MILVDLIQSGFWRRGHLCSQLQHQTLWRMFLGAGRWNQRRARCLQPGSTATLPKGKFWMCSSVPSACHTACHDEGQEGERSWNAQDRAQCLTMQIYLAPNANNGLGAAMILSFLGSTLCSPSAPQQPMWGKPHPEDTWHRPGSFGIVWEVDWANVGSTKSSTGLQGELGEKITFFLIPNRIFTVSKAHVSQKRGVKAFDVIPCKVLCSQRTKKYVPLT